MAKRMQMRRLLLLAVLLGGGFALLGYRLVDLQVLRHAELQAKAQQNTVREVRIPARRGDILDARGNLLATSVVVKTVCADPTLLDDSPALASLADPGVTFIMGRPGPTNSLIAKQELGAAAVVARALAPILELNEAELRERLRPRTIVNRQGRRVPVQYVVLKPKVPVETWEKVRRTMAQLTFAGDDPRNAAGLTNRPVAERKLFYRNLRQAAVFADPVDDQVRHYPNQSLAAHVLGYVGRNGDAETPHFGQWQGVDGIERVFNEQLTGTPGWRVTETDSRRREMVARRNQDVPARDGLSVVLTIDSVAQHLLEKALAAGYERHAPNNLSGIIVRPRTGEILALATWPGFDPNRVPSDAGLRRNRIITDVDEPGSTFKIVVVSGALNEGLVGLGTVFDCEQGRFRFGGRTLHDHDPYGLLNVETIITKSSNIGAAKIGIKLGNRRLYEYLCDYGFGLPTGIALPNESRGIVHPPQKWSKVSIAQIPMGHGIAVTRLQMAMAMSAMANNGWLMRPMLVNRLVDRDGQVVAQYEPQRVRQVVSEAAARQTVQALKMAVSPDGTGNRAALTNYTVAGKTGTAQKAGPGGYMPGKYVSSFIGFFPADNPELCISIVLDEPKRGGYYGGVVAAPIFQQVAESVANYLHVPPDKPEAVAPRPGGAPGDVSDFRSLQTAVVNNSRNP